MLGIKLKPLFLILLGSVFMLKFWKSFLSFIVLLVDHYMMFGFLVGYRGSPEFNWSWRPEFE